MKTLKSIPLALLVAVCGTARAQTTLPPAVEEYFALEPASYVQALLLAASTAESVTAPTDAKYVLFSCTDNFYVNWTTTATVPGDVTNGGASELNPTMRRLRRGGSAVTGFSVISAGTPVCTFSFYK